MRTVRAVVPLYYLSALCAMLAWVVCSHAHQGFQPPDRPPYLQALMDQKRDLFISEGISNRWFGGYKENCKAYTSCIGANGRCNYCDESDPEPECSRVCRFPYDCPVNRPIRTCVQSLINMECNDTVQCQGIMWDPPLVCNANAGGLCKVVNRNLYPGDRCKSDEECLSGDCHKKKCRGATENGSCNSTADCGATLFCDAATSTCLPRFRSDEAPENDGDESCVDFTAKNDDDDDPDRQNVIAPASLSDVCREAGYFCEQRVVNTDDDDDDGNNNAQEKIACMLGLGGKKGDPCRNPQSCDAGLACHNGTCVAPVQTLRGRRCFANGTVDNGVDNDTQLVDGCGAGMGCACDNGVGENQCASIANRCEDKHKTYWRCLRRRSCHEWSDPRHPRACARGCFDALKELLKCEARDLACGPSAASAWGPGGSSLGASLIGLVVALLCGLLLL